jgi:hypothetical protein
LIKGLSSGNGLIVGNLDDVAVVAKLALIGGNPADGLVAGKLSLAPR